MTAKPKNLGRKHYLKLQAWARRRGSYRLAHSTYEKINRGEWERRARGVEPQPKAPRKPKRKMANSRKRRRDRVVRAMEAGQ